MRKLQRYFFFFCLWLGFAGSQVAYANLKLRGYAESRYAYLFGTDLAGICGDYAPGGSLNIFCNPQILINRIRPSVQASFTDKATLRATFNVLTTHLGLERDVKTVWDILTIDRFYLELRTKYVDFRLGKQSFEWGPAVIWNLTAPFNQQNLFEPNAERPGLWGLNAYIGYSQTGGFRFGVLAEPDITISSEQFVGAKAFLRWAHTFGETQVATTFLWSSSQKLFTIGADIKGQLEVGFWSEAAVTIPYETEALPAGQDPRKVNFQIVAGIDYSFPVLDRLIFTLQYYYNLNGKTNPEDYALNTPTGKAQLDAAMNLVYTASRSASVTAPTGPFNPGNFAGLGVSSGFLGAHYLLFSAQLGFLEDFNISLFALANLLDPSITFGPGFTWNFLSNFTLSLTAYFSLGPDGSEFSSTTRTVTINENGTDVKKEVRIQPLATLLAQFKYNF